MDAQKLQSITSVGMAATTVVQVITSNFGLPAMDSDHLIFGALLVYPLAGLTLGLLSYVLIVETVSPLFRAFRPAKGQAARVEEYHWQRSQESSCG